MQCSKAKELNDDKEIAVEDTFTITVLINYVGLFNIVKIKCQCIV